MNLRLLGWKFKYRNCLHSRSVRNRNVISVKFLHKKFIDAWIEEEIKLKEYSFITKDKGKRSLERYVKKLRNPYFSEVSKRYGKQAAKHSHSMVRCSKNKCRKRIVCFNIPFKKYEGIPFYIMAYPTKGNDAAEFHVLPEKEND